MTREEARQNINSRPLTDFIDLSATRKAGQNMYICPVCKSGTGKNKTGAFHIYPDSNRVFCHARNCFSDKGEDTIGALKIIWNCGEFEVIKRIGYDIEPYHTQETQETQIYKQLHDHKEKNDYSAFYLKAYEELKNTPDALEYLYKRGITDESIDRFKLGYCKSWTSDNTNYRRSLEGHKPINYYTKRIIIPRSKNTYTARAIDPTEPNYNELYKKQIEGFQNTLFNLKAIEGATPFVVEGEIDAISLYQAGANDVIAIGSITNTGKFLSEARKHPENVYILAFDNDRDKEDGSNPGKQAQINLAQDMEKYGLDFINIDPAKIYGISKDGNEAYIRDKEGLKKAINTLQIEAQKLKTIRDEERIEELKKRTGQGMVNDFLFKVKTKDFKPIPTGIKDIDIALEGGFTRKTLVMLGAAPGMGKTALAQWIFENMAIAGHDVLYINLEMDRNQLLARSISRIAWKYDQIDISALQVLRGYDWTERQQEIILKSIDLFSKNIAPKFIYNPDGIDNKISNILSVMESETSRIKAQGRNAPIICIDYLQLIDHESKDTIEGMKSVIFKLKDFAKNNDTIVFCIMANNRASNKLGSSNLESGRDTSAIEYSGDVMLGLVYTAIEDKLTYTYKYEDKNGEERSVLKEYDIEEIRRLKKEARDKNIPVPKVCNCISLKINKNRFGEDERRAKLVFDGKHASFSVE